MQRNRLPSKVCSTSFALGTVLFSSSAQTFTTYRACRSCTANHFRQRLLLDWVKVLLHTAQPFHVHNVAAVHGAQATSATVG